MKSSHVVNASLVCILACTLTGCASSPESIAPTSVSEAGYMELSCDQLTQEQAKLAGSLMAASDAQRATRRGDTIGIILIGLPTSTIFGGSVTPEIARIKGEIQAVQKAGELKNCNLTPIDVLPPKPQQTSNPDI